MNLELLDPFDRQVPDRIDATIELPAALHFRSHDGPEVKKASTSALSEWKSSYHVAFNRRGTYLAVGYGSGTVAVFHVLSRTLAALYRNEDENANPSHHGLGISSVSWSRRSRTLLAGSMGDATIRLFDTTHPYGSEEGSAIVLPDEPKENDDDVMMKDSPFENRVVTHTFEQTATTSFKDVDQRFTFARETRLLTPIIVRMGEELPAFNGRPSEIPSDARGLQKYPAIAFNLSEKVGAALQIHPKVSTGGLVVLENGSLLLFWQHPSAWVDGDSYETTKPILVPIWESCEQHITCAAFDPQGNRVYASTKDGAILGFDVTELWKVLTIPGTDDTKRRLPRVLPHFHITVPSSAASWHLIVTRNGKFLAVNSADGGFRLFSTKECWETPDQVKKPLWIFQDVVSKLKFASCDLSGDGEYLVGGANGEDYKYELYIWNTSTGILIDKLIGPAAKLYSVAWHPTRAFIAVATSDGLIDVWGPRINWTKFAPDFQALPMNVEYIEGEDELDLDTNNSPSNRTGLQRMEDGPGEVMVDVRTWDPLPVFASDSEREEEVFQFETKIRNLLAGRRTTKSATFDD